MKRSDKSFLAFLQLDLKGMKSYIICLFLGCLWCVWVRVCVCVRVSECVCVCVSTCECSAFGTFQLGYKELFFFFLICSITTLKTIRLLQQPRSGGSTTLQLKHVLDWRICLGGIFHIFLTKCFLFRIEHLGYFQPAVACSQNSPKKCIFLVVVVNG